MTVARSTQVIIEELSTTDPKARVSQIVIETLSENVADDTTEGDQAIVGFFFGM